MELRRWADPSRRHAIGNDRDPEDDDFPDVSHLVVSGEAPRCADCGNPTTEVFTIPDTDGGRRKVCPLCARMCRAKVSIRNAREQSMGGTPLHLAAHSDHVWMWQGCW